MKRRKVHAPSRERLTMCGLGPSRRYVAHPTSGALVNCVDCLRALVDALTFEEFRRFIRGERIAPPLPRKEKS